MPDASGQKKDEDEENDRDAGSKKKKRKFHITSPVVFDRLMAVCLMQCHEEFYHHLLKSDDDKDDDDSTDKDSEDDDESSSENEKHGDKKKKKSSYKSLEENKPLNRTFSNSYYALSPNTSTSRARAGHSRQHGEIWLLIQLLMLQGEIKHTTINFSHLRDDRDLTTR